VKEIVIHSVDFSNKSSPHIATNSNNDVENCDSNFLFFVILYITIDNGTVILLLTSLSESPYSCHTGIEWLLIQQFIGK